MDDDMPVGKFKEYLHDQLNECRVLLAIIGRNWLNARDQHGHRRLDDAEDWVRAEIGSALDRGIKVVPVIIDDGDLPKPSDLPSNLKSLPEFQAFRVRNNQFERDSAALADRLREALGQTNASTVIKERFITETTQSIAQKARRLLVERRGFWALVGAIVGLLIISFGLGLISDGSKPSEEGVKSEATSSPTQSSPTQSGPTRSRSTPSRPTPNTAGTLDPYQRGALEEARRQAEIATGVRPRPSESRPRIFEVFPGR
jgi:hypothetical protein